MRSNKYLKALVSLLFLVCSVTLSAQTPTVTGTYYHTDALGSIVAASDEQGAILWRKTYDPYGNEVISTENGDEFEGQAYTGKPFDEETGLVYLGQRYYDPQIKRFMGMDPVGFRANDPTSFNRYAYANNNPYKYVDPDGRESVFALQKNINVRDFGQGNITRQEFQVRNEVPPEMGLFAIGGLGALSVRTAYAWYFANAYRANQAAMLTAEAVAGVPIASGAYTLARNGVSQASMGADDVIKALPAPSMVKHHIFNVFRGASPRSQKYRDFFKRHGIELDSQTIQLTVDEHKLVHQAGFNWTTQWKRWIDANPNATTKEVYQQAGRMMDVHGVGHKPIVPYK